MKERKIYSLRNIFKKPILRRKFVKNFLHYSKMLQKIIWLKFLHPRSHKMDSHPHGPVSMYKVILRSEWKTNFQECNFFRSYRGHQNRLNEINLGFGYPSKFLLGIQIDAYCPLCSNRKKNSSYWNCWVKYRSKKSRRKL